MDNTTVRVLEEHEFSNHIAALIKSGGDIEAAGLTLDDIRNMIYTRRVRINPEIINQKEDEGGSTVAKPKKTRGPTIKGADLDDFLS